MYTLDELFGMKGRSVVVVGGTSGIGFEIASALLDLGAQVAVIGRTASKCEVAEKRLQEKNPNAMALCSDVVDTEKMTEAFTQVVEKFGTVDGLVYSAGINHIEGLDTIDLKNFNRVMDVNFNGFVLSCKLAGQYMLENNFGTIVGISSYSTHRGKPCYTAYCASKAAIDGFARALSVEWAQKGIRVNTIAPGLVITDINRKEIEANPENFKKRVASIPRGCPGELASLVGPAITLLSQAGHHMIGQTLNCDGGTTAGDMFYMTKSQD